MREAFTMCIYLAANALFIPNAKNRLNSVIKKGGAVGW